MVLIFHERPKCRLQRYFRSLLLMAEIVHQFIGSLSHYRVSDIPGGAKYEIIQRGILFTPQAATEEQGFI